MIACDLGSNTFRVVEIDCVTKDRIREFERVVKTAEGIVETGLISEKAIKRVITAIKEAQNEFDLRDAKAVTTAAMRKAKNSSKVLQQIENETSLKFEIIDTKQEADYTRIAILNRLKVENYVLMDLGGGSTELIFDSFSKSFDIGIVTLVDKYSLEDLHEGIKKEFNQICEFVSTLKYKPDYFIATAGTPTTISSVILGLDYDHYDYKKVNAMELSLDQIDEVLEKLIEMSEEQRIKWVGVGREDLIVAGILMFKEIVKIFGFASVTIIDDGLREGVAISMCH